MMVRKLEKGRRPMAEQEESLKPKKGWSLGKNPHQTFKARNGGNWHGRFMMPNLCECHDMALLSNRSINDSKITASTATAIA
jgi:hypothetical protein